MSKSPPACGQFAMVPVELLEACAESKARLFIYLWLWHYAGKNDQAFPSLSRLSADCRMRRNDLVAGLAWLEAEGWIAVERRAQQSNTYRVRRIAVERSPKPGGKKRSPSVQKATSSQTDTSVQKATSSQTDTSVQKARGVVSESLLEQEALTRREEIQEKNPLTPIDPAEPLATVGPDPEPTPTASKPPAAPQPPAAPEPAAEQPVAIAQPLEPQAAAIKPQAFPAPCQEPVAGPAASLALCSPLAAPQGAADPMAGPMEPQAPCSPPAAAKPARKGRKPTGPVPLPPDAPPLDPAELELLTAWWQLRCDKHPRANRTKLGSGNLAALAEAAQRGVLLAYLHKAEMAGWQSLDHNGRSEAIERLAAAHQLATSPQADFLGGGLHPGNRMYALSRPNPGQPSRRQQTMARLNNLFKSEDGGPDDHP